MACRFWCPISLLCTLSNRVMSSSTRLGSFLKNITKPELISEEYWKQILWVAKDLKRKIYQNKKKGLKLLETKHVTLLFAKPHGRFQLAFTLACDLLGARQTLYHDPHFENQLNPGDSGRVLSMLTDMFVIHGLHHDVLIKVVSHATVPVFSASSNVYCLQKALSDLMTFHEKFDRFKGLKLAWIGPPNSIFNAYVILCSKLGINIQYTCICSYGAGRMSPVHGVPSAMLEAENLKNASGLKECKDAVEAVRGAHIIATSMHPEEENKITLEVRSCLARVKRACGKEKTCPNEREADVAECEKSDASECSEEQLLKNADPNFVFMHSLPRSSKEVTEEVFNHESNLSLKTSENYLFVAMAVILTSLKEYQPELSQPNFGCF